MTFDQLRVQSTQLPPEQRKQLIYALVDSLNSPS